MHACGHKVGTENCLVQKVLDIFGRNILKMSKPWVFTPSDKPPVLVYGAFVKSVVVLILMKIVTIVSTFISTFIDRNSEIGPNLRCLGHPPSRAEFASLFSLLEGGSPRAASGGVILIPRAPLHAGTPPRLGSDSPGGRRQTVPRRSTIRGPLA